MNIYGQGHIFADCGKCKTIIELPVWFGKKKCFDSKTRIRNHKKYAVKYNFEYEGGEEIA